MWGSRDGATVTVYGIDAEIVESADGLCDLSAAAITGETEMRFEYYGDTLVRRIAGRQADWLRISNDTIWSLGADTHRENTRYGRGLPYLLPSLSAETGDSVRHSVFMSIDRENRLLCRYSSSRGCGFILPGSDPNPSSPTDPTTDPSYAVTIDADGINPHHHPNNQTHNQLIMYNLRFAESNRK